MYFDYYGGANGANFVESGGVASNAIKHSTKVNDNTNVLFDPATGISTTNQSAVFLMTVHGLNRNNQGVGDIMHNEQIKLLLRYS